MGTSASAVRGAKPRFAELRTVSGFGTHKKLLALGWRSASSAAVSSEQMYGFQPPRCFVAAPFRGTTGDGCYFITASTFQKRSILQSDRMAQLFVDVLLHYRRQQKYRLYEFAVMPDHFHLLITPVTTLERAMQRIKGGFSYRAKKEIGFVHEMWQPSYYDRRVRNAEEYCAFREYIRQNPVKKRLAATAEEFRFVQLGSNLR